MSNSQLKLAIKIKTTSCLIQGPKRTQVSAFNVRAALIAKGLKIAWCRAGAGKQQVGKQQVCVPNKQYLS